MQSLAGGLARYFSPAQLARLGSAMVGVVGAGGLGSNVSMMLVRSGIRHITLVDHDRIEASNLNRQAYLPEDIGKLKVEALARHLRTLEPALDVHTHALLVTRENGVPLLAHCPIVVEAVDSAATKLLLYETFSAIKELYVTASGMGGFGYAEEAPMRLRRPRKNVVIVGDFRTEADELHPPLAPRVMQAAAMQADAVLTHILS